MLGYIVKAKAGRDKNNFFCVVDYSENTVKIANGKQRMLEKPKLKNIKHIQFTKTVLSKEEYKTNKKLKQSLKVYYANV